MPDQEFNSPCEWEDEVYRQFTKRFNETFRNSEWRSFRDILGDALDDMLWDDDDKQK